MKRSIMTVVLMAALIQYSDISAQNNIIDEVVWVVGDEAIYKSEVEKARQDALMMGMQWDGDPYCLIPEQLAVNKLFLNQAELDSIFVTDEDVTQQVDYDYGRLLERYVTEDNLEDNYEMTVDEIKARLYEKNRQEYIISRVRNKIISRVKVTPGDVRRYLKDIPADEIPSIPNQVEVQIITLDPVIPQEEIDDVKRELRDYIDRVQNGEVSFSTLAVLYSEDPGSARNGGDLGFFGRNQMVPEFSAVAFNMTDPAKISKIVETEYGFHILQFVERLGDRVRVRHILRKPKIPTESIDNCLARLDSIAQDIRSGGHSFEYNVAEYSQDKNTRKNNGLMTFRTEMSPMLGVSKVELQYLPQDVAKVVDRMHVGEISDPFVMQMDGGKTTCAIVKLKNKVNAHKANMADDYDILFDIVSSMRQQEALEKWVREKQRTTYVRISEGWNDCEFMYPGWGKR